MSLFKREHCSKEETVIDMLASALDRHNLSEIEYGRYGIKLRLAKYGVSAPVHNNQISNVPAELSNESNLSDKKLDGAKLSYDETSTVKSPMVGVVYLSSNPSQPPYVKKGDEVKIGDTLCLIEAMKTFNPVKADKTGIVKEILVKESQSVEYGEPLFVIE